MLVSNISSVSEEPASTRMVWLLGVFSPVPLMRDITAFSILDQWRPTEVKKTLPLIELSSSTTEAGTLIEL